MNMGDFGNFVIREFLERLEEVDRIMCPNNTPYQVFNFVKFCKKDFGRAHTDLASVRRAQGVTFKVSL